MPTKLGLPAIVIACLLAVAAPVLADDNVAEPSPTSEATSPPTTVSPDPDTPPVESTGAPPETSAPTPTITGSLEAARPGGIDGPAAATWAPPTRGQQIQIASPPPSPFDPPANTGSGRRAVYSKSKQTVWVYDANNTIIKMHRVSGRQDPNDPTPGTYRVWSRSLRTFSINNPSITWSYMVRFAKGDRGGNIGFHEIPYQYGRPVQTIDQLGQALSGGCVRQAPADAIWMWNWAHIGTVVVVTP